MRKLFILFFFIVALTANSRGLAQDVQPAARVTVYYFHGSFRCVTCTNMEKYSREAVETNFKVALASGKLEFKAVNVDEPDNVHFAEDYKLYTKTLIVSLVKDGREERYKNLDMIWQLVRNKQEFIDYVAAGVNEFLKEAQ